MEKFKNYNHQLQSESTAWPAYCLDLDRNYSWIKKNNRDADIVEFGPGRGYFVDWLLTNGFSNITIVDVDEENCKFLEVKYKNFSNVRVLYDSMYDFLRDAEKQYDVIVSRQVIEHLPIEQIRPNLEATVQRLKSGGVGIHETINAANLVYGNYSRYIDFSHTIAFTEKSVNEFASGLKVSVKNYYSSSMFRLVKEKIFRHYHSQINNLKRQLVFVSSSQETQLFKKKTFSTKISELFGNLLFQLRVRIRLQLAYFLTYIFMSDNTKIYSHYLIIELTKE